MLNDRKQYVEEYSTTDGVLNARDYHDALMVQNASNLSGVVLSFAEVMKKICEESSYQQKGTSWKNRHPICILYLCTIANLTTGDIIDTEHYSAAYDICKEKAR